MEQGLYECLDVGGTTILEEILKKRVSIRLNGLIRLKLKIIGVPCECVIEPPGFISRGVSL